jgi:threonine/homoserine/homoserine lactone efflux protein
MSPERWAAFVGVLVVVLVVPGPDFAVVVRHSLSGPRPGLRASAGILTGLLLHTGAAAVGLSALVSARPWLLDVVRVAGACYLAWLGLRALRTFLRPAASGSSPALEGHGSPYRDGLAANALNPKAILFFLGLLPQFMTAEGSVLVQTLLLAATTLVLCALWWALVVWAVSRGRGLSGRPRVRRTLDGATAGVFLALAGSLLL